MINLCHKDWDLLILKGEDYRWGGQVIIRVIAEVGIWLELVSDWWWVGVGTGEQRWLGQDKDQTLDGIKRIKTKTWQNRWSSFFVLTGWGFFCKICTRSKFFFVLFYCESFCLGLHPLFFSFRKSAEFALKCFWFLHSPHIAWHEMNDLTQESCKLFFTHPHTNRCCCRNRGTGKQRFCFLQQLHSAAACNFSQLLHNYRADASFSAVCSLSQVGLRRGLLGGVSVCEGAHAGVQPQEWLLHLPAWISRQKVSERYPTQPGSPHLLISLSQKLLLLLPICFVWLLLLICSYPTNDFGGFLTLLGLQGHQGE